MKRLWQNKLTLDSPVFKNNIESDFEIRQTIMEDMRDLSWVHIFKKGSKVTIIPQLAPITDIKEQKPEQLNHLVAAKSGVITHFVLTSGERRVLPNTTVYEGDTLVSGVITVGDKFITIGAVGEVYADYWLETEFTIPKKVQFISSTERKWTINLKLNDEKEQVQSFQEVRFTGVAFKIYRNQRDARVHYFHTRNNRKPNRIIYFATIARKNIKVFATKNHYQKRKHFARYL